MPLGLKAVVLCASFITCYQKLVPTWASVLVFDFPFYASRIFAKINAWFGGYDGDDMQMALSLVKPEVMAYRLRQVIKVNVTPELAQCNLPILYLQGKNDILVSHANFEQIKKQTKCAIYTHKCGSLGTSNATKTSGKINPRFY